MRITIQKFTGLGVAAVALAVAATACLLLRGHPPIEDETFHYGAVSGLLKGQWPNFLPMFPGAHLLLAGLALPLGLGSLDGVRLISTLIGLASVLVFYKCAKHLNPDQAPVRTLQYLFLPLLSHLQFLVYTEPTSFLFLLLAVLAFLKRRFTWCGIAGAAAVLVRQTNVIWLAMLPIMSYVDEHGWEFRPHELWPHLRRSWYLAPGITVFLSFALHNRGLVVRSSPAADKILTGPIPFHTLNIYFAMATLLMLLSPVLVARFPAAVAAARRRPRILFEVGLLFAVYLVTFRPNHPWNTADHWYLMNYPVEMARASQAGRILLFLPAAVVYLHVRTRPMERPSMDLIFPFAALSLAPFWLISVRYELPAFVMYVLCRRMEGCRLEWITTIYMFLLSAAFFAGMIADRCFV